MSHCFHCVSSRKVVRSRKSSVDMSRATQSGRCLPGTANEHARHDSFVITPACLAALFTVLVFESTAAAAPDEMGAQLFREKIQPVLEANCFECHSAKATK